MSNLSPLTPRISTTSSNFTPSYLHPLISTISLISPSLPPPLSHLSSPLPPLLLYHSLDINHPITIGSVSPKVRATLFQPGDKTILPRTPHTGYHCHHHHHHHHHHHQHYLDPNLNSTLYTTLVQPCHNQPKSDHILSLSLSNPCPSFHVFLSRLSFIHVYCTQDVREKVPNDRLIHFIHPPPPPRLLVYPFHPTLPSTTRLFLHLVLHKDGKQKWKTKW